MNSSDINQKLIQLDFTIISFVLFTDIRTYTYPSVSIPEFDLFEDQLTQSSWAIVTLAPKEGLCKTKDAKECTNECTLCQDTCFYNMELHRSASPCNDRGN